ncbi:hypothetical protein [Corynebacterium heidelbergense]|uniref:hypothetical protein n=1 Tax=Corynebacterium heidelbergense TaxID=2055947 RepID=UPI001057BA2D|nr:hypothetical protein [Corynebacterium heidelbergense]
MPSDADPFGVPTYVGKDIPAQPGPTAGQWTLPVRAKVPFAPVNPTTLPADQQHYPFVEYGTYAEDGSWSPGAQYVFRDDPNKCYYEEAETAPPTTSEPTTPSETPSGTPSETVTSATSTSTVAPTSTTAPTGMVTPAETTAAPARPSATSADGGSAAATATSGTTTPGAVAAGGNTSASTGTSAPAPVPSNTGGGTGTPGQVSAQRPQPSLAAIGASPVVGWAAGIAIGLVCIGAALGFVRRSSRR